MLHERGSSSIRAGGLQHGRRGSCGGRLPLFRCPSAHHTLKAHTHRGGATPAMAKPWLAGQFSPMAGREGTGRVPGRLIRSTDRSQARVGQRLVPGFCFTQRFWRENQGSFSSASGAYYRSEWLTLPAGGNLNGIENGNYDAGEPGTEHAAQLPFSAALCMGPESSVRRGRLVRAVEILPRAQQLAESAEGCGGKTERCEKNDFRYSCFLRNMRLSLRLQQVSEPAHFGLPACVRGAQAESVKSRLEMQRTRQDRRG